MKNHTLVIFGLLLVSCAQFRGGKGDAGAMGEPCTVTKIGTSAQITCPDGTTATVSDGRDGHRGQGAGIYATSEPSACAGAGGVAIVTFEDPANTGLYAPSDPITSAELVCNGVPGRDGQNSSIGLMQASNEECPSGGYDITITTAGHTASSPVCNGVKGDTGAMGMAGPDDLSMVQFCPGYHTQYPGVFAEEAMCVSGSLYAVFWDDNNAWLTSIPPGEYRSTSTSAPCNFKVTANCGVEAL